VFDQWSIQKNYSCNCFCHQTQLYYLFQNNYGAKPPSNKYINQKEEIETYKKPQRGREGKKAPNQQLGLEAVYQAKTTERRRNRKLEDSILYGLKPI
jgi:hypothetical protein